MLKPEAQAAVKMLLRWRKMSGPASEATARRMGIVAQNPAEPVPTGLLVQRIRREQRRAGAGATVCTVCGEKKPADGFKTCPNCRGEKRWKEIARKTLLKRRENQRQRAAERNHATSAMVDAGEAEKWAASVENRVATGGEKVPARGDFTPRKAVLAASRRARSVVGATKQD
jgi:hypothetical protein